MTSYVLVYYIVYEIIMAGTELGSPPTSFARFEAEACFIAVEQRERMGRHSDSHQLKHVLCLCTYVLPAQSLKC